MKVASGSLTFAKAGSGRVKVKLTPAGRRLLKGRRRVPAQLTVTGTVIGVIKALLAQQRLVLGAAARGASRNGPAHRP